MTCQCEHITTKYKGFSDFMRNATPEDKKHVFEDAAQEATEKQRHVIGCRHNPNCPIKY